MKIIRERYCSGTRRCLHRLHPVFSPVLKLLAPKIVGLEQSIYKEFIGLSEYRADF